MLNPDELRGLIQQVADRDGPLRFFTDSEGVEHITWDDRDNRESAINSVEVAWLSEPDSATYDALAGVLRRDMIHRGLYDVTHVHNDEDRHTVVWSFNQADGESQADDVLTAFLNAWLEAARKLRWRPSGEAA